MCAHYNICTIAHLLVLVQDETSSTGARIASRKVSAVLITTTIVDKTFINICKSKVLLKDIYAINGINVSAYLQCRYSQSNQHCTYTVLELSTAHLYKEDHNPLQGSQGNVKV